MATVFCQHCGAPNVGTRFCENCGQPAAGSTAPSAVGPVVGAPHVVGGMTSVAARRHGSPLNVLTFIAYVASLVVPTIIGLILNALPYGGYQGYVVQNVISGILLLATAGSSIVAAFTSPTTPGRRVGGGFLAIGAALLFAPQILMSLVSTYSVYGSDLSLLAPVLLFLAWAVTRPFRGPGYFALLIGLVLTGIGIAISFLPFAVGFNSVWMFALGILGLILSVVIPFATVGAAKAFEKKGPSPAATMPAAGAYSGPLSGEAHGAGQVAHTNSLAMMSMVFGIVGFGLVAVILGHVAKGQIRHTREAGDGMATAGLILGYLGASVAVIVIIIYIVIIARLGSYGAYY